MKMKEIGSRGRPWHPFDPPMGTVVSTLLEHVTRLSVNDRNLVDLATDL